MSVKYAPSYPRYTVYLGTAERPKPRLGFRVSAARYRELATVHGSTDSKFIGKPPRFRVKVDLASDLPLVIADADHPHFRGRAKTIEKAMLIIDNRVRKERGFPLRPHFTRAEIREAMSS